MMMYSAISLLLAASGAAAQRHKAFDRFSGFIDPTPSNTPPTVVPGSFDGTRTTATARVECQSAALASSLSSYSDIYAEAVAYAVADVCGPAFIDLGVAPLRARFLPWATAYAEAHAAALAQCQSEETGGGQAQGCAWAVAQAEAVSVAYAGAHARASAEAFASDCTCTNAEAWAFGQADLFLALISEAYAKAEAIACASGNQYSLATAYVSCYAEIIATVFARAAAEASASAQCFIDGGDADAYAAIIAEVRADLVQYESCTFDGVEIGLADVNFQGSGAFTTPLDITHPSARERFQSRFK